MEPLDLEPARLRAMPLPRHAEGDDKEGRGAVLVVGGSAEVPGAVLLAGVAALRAGAGKLQLATVRSAASGLALAVPEARVTALAETERGEIAPDAARALCGRLPRCGAVLVGPGMLDGAGAGHLVAALLGHAAEHGTPFVLDAAALHGLWESSGPLRAGGLAGRVAITPHAGEMATLLGVPREEVLRDRLAAAREAATALGVVVAMKGGGTFVVAPDGREWHCGRGNVGLATSGSGDTLAGVIAGLVARGAEVAEATAWGVFLHAEAGDRLARRTGPVGFLARELLAEIPCILAEFDVQ